MLHRHCRQNQETTHQTRFGAIHPWMAPNRFSLMKNGLAPSTLRPRFCEAVGWRQTEFGPRTGVGLAIQTVLGKHAVVSNGGGHLFSMNVFTAWCETKLHALVPDPMPRGTPLSLNTFLFSSFTPRCETKHHALVPHPMPHATPCP